MRAQHGERRDVPVHLGRVLLHLGEDVADDLLLTVLGDVEQLRPREAVVKVVLHLVVLGEAHQVAVLHLPDVLQGGGADAHHARRRRRRYRSGETRRRAVVAIAGGEHHSLCVDDEGVCYSWGVGQNVMQPIHHQFGRSANSPRAARGRFHGTPTWPSHTDQFGTYYVRGPW